MKKLTRTITNKLHFTKQSEWREWLVQNVSTATCAWLGYKKKHTGLESIRYEQALDEALCFGWIDSTAKPIDEDSYMQYFTKRKQKSQWSKKNKDRVKELISEGKMTEHGLSAINQAKENGMWDAMNDVYALVIPSDLEEAFEENSTAKENFEGFSRSVRQSCLSWLFQAKREETRKKRIEQIVSRAEQNLRPKFM